MLQGNITWPISFVIWTGCVVISYFVKRRSYFKNVMVSWTGLEPGFTPLPQRSNHLRKQNWILNAFTCFIYGCISALWPAPYVNFRIDSAANQARQSELIDLNFQNYNVSVWRVWHVVDISYEKNVQWI